MTYAGIQRDDAKEAYLAAIQMIGQSHKAIWDSFRSLLAANAILVGFGGAILKLYPDLANLARILGLLGILVCVAWALITARGFGYQRYWFAWARRYEEIAFGSTLEMIQLGAKFAKGETIEQLPDDGRLSWFGRLFKIQWLMYVVIATFIVVYYHLVRAAA